MTQEQAALEIINKFNLHYDNILSAASPGISKYEISLYMTQAIKEIIYNYYSGNSKGDTYDSNEKVKSFLAYFTKDSEITDFADPVDLHINLNCKDVTLSNDVAWILKENIKGEVNGNTVSILVKPINEDNFWILVEDPYKRPNKFCTRAWRLDMTKDSVSRVVRLIFPLELTLTKYQFTYVPVAPTIIVGDLTEDGEDLTINGENTLQIPESLINNPIFLDVVINRAVELATRDYKQNTLETQLSLNTRVE